MQSNILVKYQASHLSLREMCRICRAEGLEPFGFFLQFKKRYALLIPHSIWVVLIMLKWWTCYQRAVREINGVKNPKK